MKKIGKLKRKQILSALFFLYLLFIIRVIVFKYPVERLLAIADAWKKDVILEGLSTANFTPFKTIKMYIRYYDLPGLRSFSNLFGNIFVFVPVGIMLPMVHKASKNVICMLFNVLVFIVGIEVFQLFSNFGAFDVDDIILNTLGVLIGGSIYRIWSKDTE